MPPLPQYKSREQLNVTRMPDAGTPFRQVSALAGQAVDTFRAIDAKEAKLVNEMAQKQGVLDRVERAGNASEAYVSTQAQMLEYDSEISQNPLSVTQDQYNEKMKDFVTEGADKLEGSEFLNEYTRKNVIPYTKYGINFKKLRNNAVIKKQRGTIADELNAIPDDANYNANVNDVLTREDARAVFTPEGIVNLKDSVITNRAINLASASQEQAQAIMTKIADPKNNEFPVSDQDKLYKEVKKANDRFEAVRKLEDAKVADVGGDTADEIILSGVDYEDQYFDIKSLNLPPAQEKEKLRVLDSSKKIDARTDLNVFRALSTEVTLAAGDKDKKDTEIYKDVVKLNTKIDAAFANGELGVDHYLKVKDDLRKKKALSVNTGRLDAKTEGWKHNFMTFTPEEASVKIDANFPDNPAIADKAFDDYYSATYDQDYSQEKKNEILDGIMDSYKAKKKNVATKTRQNFSIGAGELTKKSDAELLKMMGN